MEHLFFFPRHSFFLSSFLPAHPCHHLHGRSLYKFSFYLERLPSPTRLHHTTACTQEARIEFDSHLHSRDFKTSGQNSSLRKTSRASICPLQKTTARKEEKKGLVLLSKTPAREVGGDMEQKKVEKKKNYTGSHHYCLSCPMDRILSLPSFLSLGLLW